MHLLLHGNITLQRRLLCINKFLCIPCLDKGGHFIFILPYALTAALDIFRNPGKIKNPLLTTWYVYHAALKTDLWKNIDVETSQKIDSTIIELYPLPELLTVPKTTSGFTGRISGIAGLLKRNLGTLQQNARYMWYIYGDAVKKTIFLAGGIGLAAFFAYKKAGQYMSSKPAQWSITIPPKTTIKSGSFYFTNKSNEPIQFNPYNPQNKFTVSPTGMHPRGQ